MMFAGRLNDAWTLLTEAVAAGQATGLATYLGTGAVMAANRGRERDALEQINALERDAAERGVGRSLGVAGYAKAVLYNGLGRYPAAMDAARTAAEYPDLSMWGWELSELVEAASRSGEPDLAAQTRNRLSGLTSAAGTPWALGAQALADALAGPPREAEDQYREAVGQFRTGGMGLLEARAQLLFGEWLRRENRRNEARFALRAASAAFEAMGAEGFAERAGRELRATGETVRRRSSDAHHFTPQEAQIARLAVEGQTNAEIGAVLFLSPRTVEWHLRKVFTKLDITNRRELAAALRDR